MLEKISLFLGEGYDRCDNACRNQNAEKGINGCDCVLIIELEEAGGSKTIGNEG